MKIPIIIKTCNVTGKGSAEGIIEFNDREFHYVIIPPAHEEAKYDISIKDINLENLKKAGFELDLDPLIYAFSKAAKHHEENLQLKKIQQREKNYLMSKLNELKPVLGANFAMISEDEYLKSKSAALFGTYTEKYRDHVRELNIFMDGEKFVIFDDLNRKQIDGLAHTPDHVKEIIDEEIKKWKHKVDFKLMLIAHGDEEEVHADLSPQTATEYFHKIQEEEKAHEREIIKNHMKYLKELGKLGEKAEIAEQTLKFVNNTDTDTFNKKKFLGSLTDEQKAKIKHPFNPEDLN